MTTSEQKKPASRRQLLVLGGSGALGCALGCSFRRPYDGQSIDLRGYNLTDPDEVPDLLAPKDLSVPRDLTQPPPPDLSGRDLSGVDLSTPPDLRPPDDLRPPPDLAPNICPRATQVWCSCR